MTEFTKKELEWLDEDIISDMEEYSMPEIAYIIHNKIKKMIEEYDLLHEPPITPSAFEILWEHKIRQIDENRAVHKSLNEIRERLDKLENPNINGVNCS